MKREDEELCKAAFNGLLIQSYAPESIHWEDGVEPPDYYLAVNDRQFAIEVTSLVEIASIGSKPSSLRGVRIALDRFVKEVETKARRQGILHGAYIITMYDYPRKLNTKRPQNRVERRPSKGHDEKAIYSTVQSRSRPRAAA